jgi:hypothetical protein
VETREITIEDVVRAGRTLFGDAFAAEAASWRDALRSTYRRRALETHPDRARALGRAEADLQREFRAVADAYRILSSLRAGPLPRAGAPPRSRPQPPPRHPPPRSAPPRPAPPPRAAAPAPGAPRVRASVHPEALPRRRLRLGEYLYYSGRLSWSELVEAIAWQRAQRPALGRIAVELGFLGPDDVGVLLEARREAAAHGVPFGEWAVRRGYLTPFQLLAALGLQLRRQRPIGEFFVARGLVDGGELDELRLRVLRHNARWPR